MINDARWFQEVTVKLVAEEIAALSAPTHFQCKPDCPKDHPWHAKKNSDETDTVELDDAEPRDTSGKWTKGGGAAPKGVAPDHHAVMVKHGYKYNPPGGHGAGYYSHSKHTSWYAHHDDGITAHAGPGMGKKAYHTAAGLDKALTQLHKPVVLTPASWQTRATESGKKLARTSEEAKSLSHDDRLEQIEHHVGALKKHGDPLSKRSSAQNADFLISQHMEALADKHGSSKDYRDAEIHRDHALVHSNNGDFDKAHERLSLALEKIRDMKTSSGVKHAASEIAALFGNPHDVSGEARDKGQFAKTPGAGAASQPTGSPLDPATGAKPPPKPHEIHKQNLDLHTKAAKTYNGLVKQHLDLAKIALSPEDRATHIEAARRHKQTAAQHTEQAGQHAQKMTTALQKALQTPQAPAATGPGVAGWNSINENQSIDPNKVSHTTPSGQPVAASVGSGMTHGPAIRREQERQEAAAAQNRPGGLDPKKLEEARRTREATNAAMGQPADPLDKAQQMPAVRTPTFAPSGEKPASDYQNRVGAAGVGAQKGNKPMPSPTMSPAQSADAKQKAQDVINRQFPKGVPGMKPKAAAPAAKPWSAKDAIRRGVAQAPAPRPPSTPEERARRDSIERSLGVGKYKPKPQGGGK